MLGQGPNLKSGFGWKSDAETGTPEVYYWQGTVRYYEAFLYLFYDSADQSYSWRRYWRFDSTSSETKNKSNKLYKLTFDHNSRKVSRQEIFDAMNTLGSDGKPIYDQYTANVRYGNLHFVSRDTFLITETVYPDAQDIYPEAFTNPDGSQTNTDGMPDEPGDIRSDGNSTIEDTYARVILHANKINDDGTVTPKVWSRLILKPGTQDGGASNDGSSENDSRDFYPGNIVGITSIPKDSPDYNDTDAYKNILIMTCSTPTGGPWPQGGGNLNQDHRRMLLRLDSLDSGIKIPDYLSGSSSWNSGADGYNSGTSSWTLVKDFGEASSGYDAREGWMTSKENGDLLYGDIVGGRFYIPSMNDHQEQATYGYTSRTSGGTGWYSNYSPGDPGQTQKMYYHTVGAMKAPLGSAVDLNVENEGSHVACKFDTGYTLDYQNGLNSFYSYFMNYNYDYDNDSDPDNPGSWGSSQRYQWNNALYGDGGCCDIYGQTEWAQNLKSTGMPHKDVTLVITNRHNLMWLLNSSRKFCPQASYNREGITVFRQEEGTNVLKVIDSDKVSFDNYWNYQDHLEQRIIQYKFDETWGNFYEAPFFVNDDLYDNYDNECYALWPPSNPNSLPDCKWFYGDGTYPHQYFGFWWWNGNNYSYFGYGGSRWKWEELQDSSCDYCLTCPGGCTGGIPSIARPGGGFECQGGNCNDDGSYSDWYEQDFYVCENSGLSFRPNWILPG